MKLSICFAFAASVLALSPSGLARRGALESLLTAGNSLHARQAFRAPAPVAKTEILEPKMRKDAIRKRISYGPLHVPGTDFLAPKPFIDPISMDPDSTVYAYSVSPACVNCTVLSGQSDLMFPNGTRADIVYGLYQHHSAMVELRPRNLPLWFCTGKGTLGNMRGAIFIVSGNDGAPGLFTSEDGQYPSGFLIRDNASFTLQAEVVNYNPSNQSIYVTQEVEYLDGIQPNYKDASISLFSATGCGVPGYEAPHGEAKYNLTSEETAMPADGVLLSGRGHLHDGGLSLVLNLNGKEVCDSVASYGGGTGEVNLDGKKWETITGMSQCAEPIPFKQGDLLSMTSVYDTSAHPLRESVHGEMQGEMGVYFISVALNQTM